jgi:small subunit ribosomal protein S6
LRRYETIFITHPELSEEDQATLQEKVRTVMAGWKGELLKIEDWGPKKLSYQIRKNARGRYFLVDYLTEAPALVRELERTLRLNDGVLKFLTVKTTERLAAEQIQALKEAAEAAKTLPVEERPAPAPAQAPPAPEEPAKTDEGGEKK